MRARCETPTGVSRIDRFPVIGRVERPPPGPEQAAEQRARDGCGCRWSRCAMSARWSANLALVGVVVIGGSGVIHLPVIREGNASPHTIASCRDTMPLLLSYASEGLGVQPSRLGLGQLDAPLFGAFLDHLAIVRIRSERDASLDNLSIDDIWSDRWNCGRRAISRLPR
jgi:hypothetical protein